MMTESKDFQINTVCNKYRGTNEEVVIPDGVIDIELPESLKLIGTHAFEGCGLETVRFPAKLSTIEWGAFSHCSRLAEVNIPQNVNKIGSAAFFKCKNLKRVSLSTGITELNRTLFAYCNNLADIVIPRGIEAIGHGTFMECDSLERIYIPKSVTYIDKEAFYRRKRKKKLTIQAHKGSYAIEYAKKMHFKYEYVEENPYLNG